MTENEIVLAYYGTVHGAPHVNPEHLEALRRVAAVAWAEGQGAGTVAALNFTPLEPNPYRTI